MTCPICREPLVDSDESDKLMTISVLRILNIARNNPLQREIVQDRVMDNDSTFDDSTVTVDNLHSTIPD